MELAISSAHGWVLVVLAAAILENVGSAAPLHAPPACPALDRGRAAAGLPGRARRVQAAAPRRRPALPPHTQQRPLGSCPLGLVQSLSWPGPLLLQYTWMGTVVNLARKRLNVEYPNLYAPPGEA